MAAVRAAAGAETYDPAVADRVFEWVQAQRSERDAPALRRRSDLDRVARRRAEEIALLPEGGRLAHDRPIEDLLRSEGVRRFRRARTYVDLQRGYSDPATAAGRRWERYGPGWSDAMDPRMDAIGIGTAEAEGDWLILVAVLLEDERLPADLRSLERETERRINDVRREHGLSPLSKAKALVDVARDHSKDMVRRGYFAHRSPDGRGVDDRVRRRGLAFRELAENLAQNRGVDGPARVAVEGWMRSSGHRANILHPGFTRTGVGIAVDEDGMIYFTQVFLRPVGDD